jgi:hypothetical protein
MVKSGIYMIVSKMTGQTYIGSSKNIKHRFAKHKHKLLSNIHTSSTLQNHVNLYSINDLEFSAIEFCDIEILISKEQEYIDLYMYDGVKLFNSILNTKNTNGAKRFTVIYPDGKREDISNLDNYCRVTNTSRVSLGNIANGTSFPYKHKIYCRFKEDTFDDWFNRIKHLINQRKQVFNGYIFLKDKVLLCDDIPCFAREHGYNLSSIRQLIHGKSVKYKDILKIVPFTENDYYKYWKNLWA